MTPTGYMPSQQLLGAQPTTSMNMAAPKQVSPVSQQTGTFIGGSPTNPAVPQTGLIGSEQALNQGLGSSNALLGAGFGGALGAINQGDNQALKAMTDYGTQLSSYSPSYSASLGSDVTGALDSAASNFNGYMAGGNNAAKVQGDLSGANGQGAQQAAYAQYQSSPAMKYQMDQMQKATERSAAARGGLLGGNVLQALQQNASGIASQDYQNQFNNLGQVAGQGLNAAGQVAGLRSNQASIAGNLQSQALQAQAAADQQKQSLQAQLADRISSLHSNSGLNKAGLFTGASQVMANNAYNTGQNVASGRTNAGLAIAQNASQTASNLSSLLNSQGVTVSNNMAQDIGTISNLIHESGMQDSIDQIQLAQILANISGGQASNLQSGYQNLGNAQAAGTMGVSNALQGGLTQAIQLGAFAPKIQQPQQPQQVSMIGNGANYGAYA